LKTPRRPQNSLRTPLNAILGTEASVRVLRVLALADSPVAAGELARRARLGRTTIYPVLEALEGIGIVEFTGVGAQRQAHFRARHPLGRPLIDLFVAEHQRVEGLVDALRRLFKEQRIRPSAAWLEGLATGDDGRDESLSLWIVAEPKTLPAMTSALAGAAEPIEQAYGVHLEIHGLARSELETRVQSGIRHLEEAVVLSGIPPVALISSRTPARASLKLHQEHDARARRLAVAISAKLKRDPTLVRTAQEHIQHRMQHASAGEQKELAEWARLLRSKTPGQLRRFLLEQNERAARLRQSLPALGLLTPLERKSVLDSATDDEARAAVSGK
jgi:hypothetical protein